LCGSRAGKAWSFPFWTGSIPPVLEEKRVVAFAGIGNPGAFRETLLALGARIVDFFGFKDHYVYQKEDLEHLVRLKKEKGAQYILTTEKDWMRMANIWPGVRRSHI
jgi:tetraacyldisaccharide 4'-kinase